MSLSSTLVTNVVSACLGELYMVSNYLTYFSRGQSSPKQRHTVLFKEVYSTMSWNSLLTILVHWAILVHCFVFGREDPSAVSHTQSSVYHSFLFFVSSSCHSVLISLLSQIHISLNLWEEIMSSSKMHLYLPFCTWAVIL